MRRRFSLVIAFIGLLGLVGLSPAQAGHDQDGVGGKKNAGPHEHSPAPVVPQLGGECAVAGRVIIGNSNNTGGVDVTPGGKNHNHFKFEDTEIVCRNLVADGVNVGDDMSHYETTFDVDAVGGTDGQGDCDAVPGKDPQCTTTSHGEQLSHGWSHSSCYSSAVPKAPGGCISSDDKSPKTTWGPLYDGTNENPPGSGQCTNCGEIEVRGDNDKDSVAVDHDGDPATPPLSDNWVKFCRGVYNDDVNGNGVNDITEAGSTCSNMFDQDGNDLPDGTNVSRGGANVLAWGALTDITGKAATEVVCFLADLEFVADPPNVGSTKLKEATLGGTAQIWLADAGKSDCAGKKKGK